MAPKTWRTSEMEEYIIIQMINDSNSNGEESFEQFKKFRPGSNASEDERKIYKNCIDELFEKIKEKFGEEIRNYYKEKNEKNKKKSKENLKEMIDENDIKETIEQIFGKANIKGNKERSANMIKLFEFEERLKMERNKNKCNTNDGNGHGKKTKKRQAPNGKDNAQQHEIALIGDVQQNNNSRFLEKNGGGILNSLMVRLQNMLCSTCNKKRNIEICAAENNGEEQQQNFPEIVILQRGAEEQLFYSFDLYRSAMDSRFPLLTDLIWIKGDLQNNFSDFMNQNEFFERVFATVENMDIHLFDKKNPLYKIHKYVRQCVCGHANGNRYHYLFNYFVQIGWIYPISHEILGKLLGPSNICPAYRGIDMYSFAYLINNYQLNPTQIRFDKLYDKLYELFGNSMPSFKNPADCVYCYQKYTRNSAHVISNLVLQLQLISIDELCSYSSYNCTTAPRLGVPVRARDLLDFFIFSGKFYVFGPKLLPPNRWEHSRSKECKDSSHINFFNSNQLPNKQLCFIFCRRRDEEVATKGNAMLFGTKAECYIGLCLYSVKNYDHWYFVPKQWMMTNIRQKSLPAPIDQVQASSSITIGYEFERNTDATIPIKNVHFSQS